MISPVDLDWPDKAVNEQIEIDFRYEGYIVRQEREVDRVRRQYGIGIPSDINYLAIRGLSNEVKQKLLQVQPETIGQASRISGVTPAAVSLLLVHLKKSGQISRPQTQAR